MTTRFICISWLPPERQLFAVGMPSLPFLDLNHRALSLRVGDLDRTGNRLWLQPALQVSDHGLRVPDPLHNVPFRAAKDLAPISAFLHIRCLEIRGMIPKPQAGYGFRNPQRVSQLLTHYRPLDLGREFVVARFLDNDAVPGKHFYPGLLF